jgi:dimethylamine/trimethylamine dehydrogenase
MSRDPRFDILFQPLKIGPVTAKNRFYQVPHCTGMGYLRPQTLAHMRRIKAEGGWGVICTEYNSIHPTSDDLPHVSASLWDDSDIRAHSLMTDMVHEHGALAGAELWYSGARSANLMTRLPSMDVASLPNLAGMPFQTKAMDKTDIRNLRRWHRKAALRARDAGFDIVYVYATHGYLIGNFLDPRINTRSDEYGGSLANRTRLVRELIEDTKDAVGDRCGVAVRFKADETIGEDGKPEHGDRREMFEMLADLPDLWDINIADYTLEMGVSRFIKEAALEPYMHWVKSVTAKPVVTVGRFTSPETMVSQLRRGIVDLIGAARPSIADPFLPKKIEEGRLDDIRECIGCNICYSGDSTGTPIRCTQNPTMGEEWRMGWHPEKSAPARSDATVLIVGAGPAGLEAARTLGLRGYRVMLAEAMRDLGGRVVREAALPGMNEYIRVRDYREQQLVRMPNVEVFRESRLTAKDVLAVGADHVVIATGATWKREIFDGKTYVSITTNGAEVATPDDIMAGRLPQGPTVVFDGDNYYMAGVIAEAVARTGVPVTYVTEEDSVSAWAEKTSERWRIRTHLLGLGIDIVTAHSLTGFDGKTVTLECSYSGRERNLVAQAVVLVTQRTQSDELYHEILATVDGDAERLPFSLKRIGDAEAPAIIAAAVYAGHRYAAELDEIVDLDQPMRHDRIDLGATQPPTAPAADGSTTAKTGAVARARDYFETLVAYFEEEVSGEAWFCALADLFPEPDRRAKLSLLADVERHCTKIVRPLIDKHGLAPRGRAELEAEGRSHAVRWSGNWDGLLGYMRESFPAYVDDFKALERMAPPADRAILQRMTEHEVVTIEFLKRELAEDASSTEPLKVFLST